VQIAHLVSKIEACDREIGRLNATSALRHGHIAPVLTGSPPPVQVLFADALVRDGFAAVANLTSKACVGIAWRLMLEDASRRPP
jgi:hypothetical protein